MRYESPKTLEQAIDIFSGFAGQKRILAGGTDILVQLRTEQIHPELLMNIKEIPDLQKIELVDGYWKIGAGVSASSLTCNESFASNWPGIVEGVGLIGSTQIQNRATLVGNLSNASPAADGIPSLISSEAKVQIVSKLKTRVVDIFSLIVGPGKIDLQHSEFISHILIPIQKSNASDCYMRFIPRSEMDIAVVGCAVNLSLNDGLIDSIKVVLGAVGPKVIISENASKEVTGTSLDQIALNKLQMCCEEAANPIDDKRGTSEFRRKVAGVLAKRAAQKAYDRLVGNA